MKNLPLAILLMSGLLISKPALSQQSDSGIITGTVTDMRTKEPLIGVNVLVVGTNLGAATDFTGNYRIDNIPLGTYSLEFLYVGYTSLYKTDIPVKKGKPSVVNTQLSEGALEGEEVTVTAGYFVEENMTPPSILALSREEIRRFPGGFEDVVRTVSTLPGVAINTSGGRNDLLVRGGGPSENLYLIENIEVPNINHFGTQGNSSGSLSFVNLDFVDNVTFSTGGFNARYGDKMSSVLELSLAEGRMDRLGGKVLISATQYGINLEGPVTSRGNFIFSARQSYLDLIFKAAGLPFVPIYTDFNFSYQYEFSPRDKIFILGLSAIDRVDRDQSTQENRVTNAGILDNSQNQYIAGINYRRLTNHGYLDFTLNSNLFQYRLKQVDEKEIIYFNSTADEQEFALKINNYRAINKSIGILSGISWKRVSNNNVTSFADSIYDRNGRKITPNQIGVNPLLVVDTTVTKLGAYADIDWVINPHINLNAGLRGDYFAFLEQAFYLAPRLSVKYKLTSRHSLKLSVGQYYQSPSYVWVINPINRNLKALSNQMIIAGWDYLARKDLRLSVEGYYKKYSQLPTGTLSGITDYLIQTNTGTGFGGREDDFQSFGYYDMVSDGKGMAYGLDIVLQKKFSEVPCYGQTSLTIGKSEYTAGNGLSYPGQYDQRLILNLSGGYIFNKSWEFSTKFRYFTGIPITPVYRPAQNPINPGFIQNLPDEYLSERLAAGHHLDVRVDRYFYLGDWTLIAFIDIQNIYNFKIPQRPRYDFWADEIITSSDIGILPSIGFSAEF